MRRPIHSLSQIATVLIFIFSSIISYSQKTFAIAFDDTYGPHGTRETTTENGKTETTKYTITRIDWLDSAGRKRKSTERYWTDAKYKDPKIVHSDSTTTLYDSTGLTPTYTNRTVYDSTGKRISYQEEFYEHAIKVSGNGWVIRDGMVHPYTYDSYTKKVDSLPPTPYKGEDESPELHLNSPANSPATEQNGPPNKETDFPQLQIQLFGGVSYINGNTPGTAGVNVVPLFPVGKIFLGLSAGFQFITSSPVYTVGSSTEPSSTFIHTSADFKNGNLGGDVVVPFHRWQFGAGVGVTFAGSTIKQEEGFTGNATAPPSVTTTTTHDSHVGPYAGVFGSYTLFSQIRFFAGYVHNDFKIEVPSAGSTTSKNVIDLPSNNVIAGFSVTFGRGLHF